MALLRQVTGSHLLTFQCFVFYLLVATCEAYYGPPPQVPTTSDTTSTATVSSVTSTTDMTSVNVTTSVTTILTTTSSTAGMADTEVITTMLNSPVSFGATQIEVADTTGLSIGMLFTISDGINSDTGTIIGITPSYRRLSRDDRRLSAGIVTIDTPLTNSYAAGATLSAAANPQAQTYFNDYKYAQTAGGASCGSGYQAITDAKACEDVAGQISGKDFGAIYHYYPVNSFPNGCATGMAGDVNYYVNPEGRNTDVSISLLCINSSFACDVSDGSGVSSSYPCVCGTDTCATDEICSASHDRCEVIKGYYETERKATSCPSGYQEIYDATACREIAEKINGKAWGDVYSYSMASHGCSTWTSNVVNYYISPGGMNTDVDIALLCINSSLTCDVSDGTAPSSSYPCVCGADTCASDEICNASASICEGSQGYYETERKASSCPDGYQAILDAAACEELAGKIGSKTWDGVYSYSTVPYGCSTFKTDTIVYYVNPGGTSTDTDVSLLCIKSTETCDVSNGTGVSSSYPCTCGADTCATGEICRAAEDRCEVIQGYFETERMASSCPSEYQEITDAAACKEVAEKINGKAWGFAYALKTVAHGCGTQMGHTVNYYLNPGGKSTDVEIALLCIRKSLTCSIPDGSDMSDSYPCVCGTDTCSSNELCNAAENQCEVLQGYVETERRASTCPHGYGAITDAAECEEVSMNITDKTWMAFQDYSAVGHGCGTWKENTVNFFVNPDGTNQEVRMALICKSTTTTTGMTSTSTSSSSTITTTDNATMLIDNVTNTTDI